uniref:Uncharacterized protein n=1 Tax=Anguilla anguilla TaxID=7936 RepID=A0A0E9P6C9_ANGAN
MHSSSGCAVTRRARTSLLVFLCSDCHRYISFLAVF